MAYTISFSLFYFSLVFSSLCQSYKPTEKIDSLNMSFLDNGVIRLGVDLNLGGAITYLSDANTEENLINNYDWGRQIQMSFYSGPIPFMPAGKEPGPDWKFLGWNPIQSGDYAGNRSRVLEYANNGLSLYVKSIPMHWPLDNVPCECTFESWIKLKGNTVKVRSRINNRRSDSTQYVGRSQELPAIYTNANYARLVTYYGSNPFTSDTLSYIKNINLPGEKIKWASWQATESWAANVNEDNYGLGIWTPGIQDYIGGFAGEFGKGVGSRDFSTAYIAPLHQEILDHNIAYEYQYVLILGNLEEIRNYVYTHANKGTLPFYEFKNDRQHWVYQNTTDDGWPIQGSLKIWLTEDTALLGPEELWKAEDAPTLKMEALYNGKGKARIFWKRFGDEDYSEDRSLEFHITADGKIHKYEIPLSNHPYYKGKITGIKLQPVVGKPSRGDFFRLRYIGFPENKNQN